MCRNILCNFEQCRWLANGVADNYQGKKKLMSKHLLLANFVSYGWMTLLAVRAQGMIQETTMTDNRYLLLFPCP